METLDNNSSKELNTSSSDENEEIIPFIPYLFKDLWELGSASAYKYELLSKNMLATGNPSIIDFGCGKGAELIQLAEKFKFTGTGIDISPEFIEDANFRKTLNQCKDIEFLVDDFKVNINNYKDFNILIFAYDFKFFGNIAETLSALKPVVKQKGHILFDVSVLKDPSKQTLMKDYVSYKSCKEQILSSKFEIAGYIYWDKHLISRNESSTLIFIGNRVEELCKKYPDKDYLFRDFLKRKQDKEIIREKELDSISWLLKSI